ncbi:MULTISPECIES: helix-turn-helix domain-containing protein [unclassified Arthrobacter]|uniref:PucR family transcriptional regulator n=1 Tax=unclassified Arthrobacter TaxID=235627 RepID=UPI001E4CB90C|nr:MULTISPECIES: helix-turn-helix domain-containing protein [unclassified Arthrobacter]MCC9145702.1 helix-turn-helix domain-containing protein [Arthrobacter sp. zg-Y919]MDK1276931.1 helix-turn-helix domain-containing protein [Arthrobacter sp. zg.Y919]MDM7989569.1 helix-turn-helix domain-containing protein [Arthrobacter sp. zg-Y877]WIB04138.1 helix-turn-helix domain-containing protein [Arthrobacter sp. zg-Y919]
MPVRPTTSAASAPPEADQPTVERLKANIGKLSTATLQQLDISLPWYRGLRPDERSALGMVAQKGIASFVNWYQRPASPAWVLSDVFGTAPTELTRSISLQKALQLIRVVVQVVEDRVPELAGNEVQSKLREAVLRYSREVAFAAADVYARAAETRGAWDTRLEALVVDAILRGESSDALRSRIAAVGWTSAAPVTVMVGGSPAEANATFVNELRRATGRLAEDTLVGIQGERLILVLGGLEDKAFSYTRLSELFGPGPVVYGPPAPSLVEAGPAAQAAFAGLTAARAWPAAPRPVAADDLWPERVMSGDDTARRALVQSIYTPLLGASNGLAETLSAYLSLGHSLEATARELFVHANTVRYRLRRVCDVTGWDPMLPREAFVLQTALVVGRLAPAGKAAPEKPATRL